MKKYVVIGNPIDHSLSPELHNHWLEQNNINGIYDKEKLDAGNLKNFFLKIRNKEVSGANVTVPFKRDVIKYLDDLSIEAKSTQSVNTIYLNDNKVIGHNTDIDGFKMAIKDTNYNVANKRVLILGAGGVVSSIIFALYKMKVTEISLCNRTRSKAENLKNLFKNLKIVDWGEIPEFDIIINATSVGLKSEDKMNLDISNVGKNKFFYDVIYKPSETNFLKTGKKLGNRTENGKMMFIYQALGAFKMWHGIQPKINTEVIKILD